MSKPSFAMLAMIISAVVSYVGPIVNPPQPIPMAACASQAVQRFESLSPSQLIRRVPFPFVERQFSAKPSHCLGSPLRRSCLATRSGVRL
jgi:hypothetical protein